ncbi:Zinc-binding dehydrogenase [Aspergillus sclerotialis]|uniref:D-xylulose reductase n=1 Tax=Aspergillus sclerotialis TaxID=2070753 RepID=A0A3A2ZLZ4_9EURO|nr:Zinc-binding dehydrogenase [Aspergillus sclerotialis]
MDDNLSWFLYGPRDAKLQSLPVPEIKDPNDVIIKIAYVGVCGSDVHFWQHGGINKKVNPENPLVLGHEASGIIHAIGTGVTSVQVGDKVAIEPGFPCRRCKFCKSGTYNLCGNMKFAAVPPDTHGTLTKYYCAPEDFVYKIPDEIGLMEAVLMEPLSVAVHSVRLAEIAPEQTVVITGSGTVGVLCGLVATVFGAERVIMVDISREKLSFAGEFLDHETFLIKQDESIEESSARLLSTMGIADAADAVIEASGAEGPVQMGIYVLKPGGSYVQTGVGKPKAHIPILALSQKELRVRGCFRYGPGDYELALKLLGRPGIHLSSLVSSITPFEDAPQAWERTGRGEGVKNLIQVMQD